ncbi:MAG: GIY-YIG nuclease family protein [Bacteroidota bacterium]
MEHPKYAVYVLYSQKDHLLYIGYTANFKRRMEEHTEGRSISTACRRPFVCVFCEYYIFKIDAMRREKYFKTSAGKRVLRLMLSDTLRNIDTATTETAT